LELTAFIHFGLDTFDGTEQGDMSDTAQTFNPTNLTQATVNAWVSTLQAAGFKQAMLTTKHSTGFTLWPSATTASTKWSVAYSPWDSGQGDIVKMWTGAMSSAGMRVGIYLAPWDQKHPSSASDYLSFYKSQLTELFSNYGPAPAFELELDGFNSPTMDWGSVFQLAKQLQPHVSIWAGPEIAKQNVTPDLQWIGNESGQATRTTSSTNLANCGGGSNRWCAVECNTSDRANWFWHPGDSPKPLSKMQSIYFATVGMNCTLIYNVPPDQTGAFDPADVAVLQQFATWYGQLYKTNLAQGQQVTADSTWATAGFDAKKAIDDDICTYWAAASGATSGRLEIDLSSSSPINVISIREPIELGERSTKYHIEVKQNGTWNTTPKDASGTTIAGTVIGQRQLWQLSGMTASAVALVIDSAKGVPAISEFGLY